MIDSVPALIQALSRTKLLTPDQLTEVVQVLQPQFADPKALARRLLQENWLTPFQVNQLFQGHEGDLSLGPYLLLERLGEGGMGQVFKARHVRLDRVVAVKVIRKEHVAHPEAIRRFRREIQAAARLNHPNVVVAYDADEVENVHFFAMEYMDGIDLSRWLKQFGPLPIPLAADFMRQAALGLQHAHELGMVHRDIKPANLFVGRSQDGRRSPASSAPDDTVPEWASSGAVVKILDMGVARLLLPLPGQEISALTQVGKVVGTPDYMPPEQAMDASQADMRSDLYALGCTFYHLVTGQVPHPGGTAIEKLVRHRMEHPVPVQQLRPETPPRLVQVIAKLMAKAPDQRFGQPVEVAQALEHADARTPVAVRLDPAVAADNPFADVAYVPPRPRRASTSKSKLPLWIPIAGGGIAILVVAGLLLGVLTGLSGSRPPPELSPAEASLAELKKNPADAENYQRLLFAFRTRYPGTPQALEAAELIMRLPSPLDRFDSKTIAAASELPSELVGLVGDAQNRHWGPVRLATFSPDGKVLASAGDDRTIRLWEVSSSALRELASLPFHGANILCLAFSPDGDGLACSNAEGKVNVWSGLRHEPFKPGSPKSFQAQGVAHVLAFAGNSQTLVAGTNRGKLHFYDLTPDEPQPKAALPGHGGPVAALGVRADGQRLAYGTLGDAKVRLVDLSDTAPKETAALEGHTTGIQNVVFSPDGGRLVSSGLDQTLRLWEVGDSDGRCLDQLDINKMNPTHLAFGPGNSSIVFLARSRQVRRWQLNDKAAKESVLVIPAGVGTLALAVAADGARMATGGQDACVRLWDAAGGSAKEITKPGPRASADFVFFTPDSKTLLVGGAGERSLRFYDTTDAVLKERTDPASPSAGFLTALALAPDGRRIAVALPDASIRLLSGRTAKEEEVLKGHAQVVVSLAYSGNGKVLAAAAVDSLVRVWHLGKSSATQIAAEGDQKLAGRVVALSPDGQWLATALEDGSIHWWRVSESSLRLQWTIAGPEKTAFRQLAFSPDGKTLAAATASGHIHFYELEAAGPRERNWLDGHSRAITAIAYTLDGRMIASCGEDGQVLLRGPATGRTYHRVRLPGPIRSLTLAADGRHLATANANGTVYILRLSPASAQPGG